VIIKKRDLFASAQRDGPARARPAYQPATSAMLSWFCRVGPRVSCPVAPKLPSSLKLHSIANVIGVTLQGRHDYNPHSRARHPAA
jgi:hypothetical protein